MFSDWFYVCCSPEVIPQDEDTTVATFSDDTAIGETVEKISLGLMCVTRPTYVSQTKDNQSTFNNQLQKIPCEN